MNSTVKSLIFWLVLIVIGVLVYRYSRGPAPLPFEDFMARVDRQEIVTATVTGDELTAKDRSGATVQTRIPRDDRTFRDRLRARNVEVVVVTPTNWFPIAANVLLLMAAVGFCIAVTRRRAATAAS